MSVEDRITDLENDISVLDYEKSKKIEQMKRLIDLLPVDNELLFFYGEGCKFTKKAEPQVKCLELSLRKRLVKLEVWNNESNQDKYNQARGKELCGGVPFFYNVRTKSTVCGAHDCGTLKEWASSNKQFNI